MSRNPNNIFENDFCVIWLWISGLAAFISVLADCCQLKLKNRCIGVCYLILTFILHEISFALYFMTIIDSLGVYPHYIVIRIVIAFTVIASLMNTFNHVMLIYHTLCKNGQNQYKQAVKIRTALYLVSCCSIFLVMPLRFFSVSSKDIWFVQACLCIMCLSHQLLTITGSERIYMIENHPTLYKLSTLPSCLGLLIIPGSWLILTLCDRLILEHEHYENEISLDIYFFFCLNLVFTLVRAMCLKARYDPQQLNVDTPSPIYSGYVV